MQFSPSRCKRLNNLADPLQSKQHKSQSISAMIWEQDVENWKVTGKNMCHRTCILESSGKIWGMQTVNPKNHSEKDESVSQVLSRLWKDGFCSALPGLERMWSAGCIWSCMWLDCTKLKSFCRTRFSENITLTLAAVLLGRQCQPAKYKKWGFVKLLVINCSNLNCSWRKKPQHSHDEHMA